MKPLLQFQNIKFSQKLLLLILAFLLCFVMTTMLNALVLSVLGADSMLYINLSILSQNLLVFILPVVITSVFVAPKPMQFLELDKVPSLKSILMVILIFAVMTPALNYLVEWNQNISLPESMAGIEALMRNAENAATAVTDMILQENNIIVSILLVGCLTGVSEEVFFRGGLQRILLSRPMNVHLAIWLAAFVFSAMHFQFYGFFPRLIIGAFFGYMALWSGSLWVAIFAHALNNSTVIVAHAIDQTYGYNLDNLGLTQQGEFPWVAMISLIVTSLLIVFYYKQSKKTSD